MTMSLNSQYDAGRRMKASPGVALTSAAIASSSGAALTGATIDRLALGRLYYSCRSIGKGRFVGSSVQGMNLAASFQHSSDGTSWDNYSTATNATAAIGSSGATGAQAVEGVVEQPVSLVGARRYIRQVLTPSFTSGTSGDNGYVSGEVVFGGADEKPVA
jgi:hypothetical protein